jgi:hypothetical protein
VRLGWAPSTPGTALVPKCTGADPKCKFKTIKPYPPRTVHEVRVRTTYLTQFSIARGSHVLPPRYTHQGTGYSISSRWSLMDRDGDNEDEEKSDADQVLESLVLGGN